MNEAGRNNETDGIGGRIGSLRQFHIGASFAGSKGSGQCRVNTGSTSFSQLNPMTW
jgi:hypothetical protein